MMDVDTYVHEILPLTAHRSGIFGYINYLVEKDRKYILDTLVNGMCCVIPWLVGQQ